MQQEHIEHAHGATATTAQCYAPFSGTARSLALSVHGKFLLHNKGNQGRCAVGSGFLFPRTRTTAPLAGEDWAQEGDLSQSYWKRREVFRGSMSLGRAVRREI